MDNPETLHEQLSTIERTAGAAHAAIDRFAQRADLTLRQVRDMAAQARQRFQTGCKNYSQWEDECVENTRERIRAKPLSRPAPHGLNFAPAMAGPCWPRWAPQPAWQRGGK